MHNLVYLSAASYLFSDEELLQILRVSRLNNSSLEVTGLLLYNEGSILQVLEGEEHIIRSLYKKISEDHRHKSVIKVIDARIEERSFGNWSMGFKQISNEDWSAINGYLNLDIKDDFKRTSGSANSGVITIIKSFANVNRISSIS